MISQDLVVAYDAFMANERYDRALLCAERMYEQDKKDGYAFLASYKAHIATIIAEGYNLSSEVSECLKRAYRVSARDVFDDFCIYTEWNRPLEQKFYLPRRKGLLPIVKQLQRLADDELDILCISMPPGVGKTGIAVFFLTWLAGRNPKDGMLGGSHNSAFLRGIYDECLREMSAEGDYLWHDVFPERRVMRTNALDMKIDVDVCQRFSTFQFTSIGAGNAGKVRSIQLLYCDDLIEGLEQAMSKDRLDKAWQLYTTDLRQRKQGNCKELHIATRWSVHDVIGRIAEQYANDPRAYIMSLPALDENGHSNFDYGGSNGFTTEFYNDIKASMDDVSWRALYMNEPIEREGLLYVRDNLRRFYELPTDEPDAIIGVCDPAEGGGDDTVCPIGYVYGEDHYIFDVVCSNALPEVTDGLLTDLLVRNSVQQCQFESNAAGGRTADKVQEMVKEKCSALNKRATHITKKRTTANKETKIIVNSSWVKEHCLFLDDTKIQPGSAYNSFLNKLCAYSVAGKNKHDDVPDAMAQYALFTETFGSNRATISRRVF